MKKFLVLMAVVAVALAGVTFVAHAADTAAKPADAKADKAAKPADAKMDMKPAKAAPQTLTGEVIDLACYTDHGASGEKHKACAAKCLAGGSAVGLLVGDKAYVISNHGDDAAYKEIRTMAAEKVKVTGTVTSQGGLNAIAIEKVEKAS
jgi:hypothetical protein